MFRGNNKTIKKSFSPFSLFFVKVRKCEKKMSETILEWPSRDAPTTMPAKEIVFFFFFYPLEKDKILEIKHFTIQCTERTQIVPR